MRYTHAATPDEINPYPLFPLPTESFIGPLQTFGDFTARELEMITHMNSNQSPKREPLDHLLSLREVPIMAAIENFFDAEMGAMVGPNARAYRAGICLAATVLRNHASTLPIPKDEWPPSTPNRSYLRVPEWLDAERANVYARLGVEQKPERTKYYVDSMSTERFVEDGAALSNAIVAMGENWEADTLSILSASPRRWNQDLFGYVCNGFADTIRLRHTLEYEARVAPVTQQILDPEFHFTIDDSTAAGAALHTEAETISHALHANPGNMAALTARYLLDGVATQEAVADMGGEGWRLAFLEAQTRWGDTSVQPFHKVISLHRAVGGFVLSKADSTEVVPVGFRKSEETFEPEAGDLLVTDGLGYGHLEEPFCIDKGVQRIAALSERGSATFLSIADELYSDPELNEHDQGFLQALQVALYHTADEHQRRILRLLPFPR